MRVMGRNLIEGIVAIPIAAIALAFGCADSDDMRSGAVSALTCQIDGVSICETRLAVVANPGLPPLIEFAAFDLNSDTAFAISFSTTNEESAYATPNQLNGEIDIYDYYDGRLPLAEYHINSSGDDIVVWNSQESTIHAVYVDETRTLEIEWDLELQQTHPIVDPRPTRRAKGKAVSPVYVMCWEPIGGATSILDRDFETEYCKPWKEFHTPARFPDL